MLKCSKLLPSLRLLCMVPVAAAGLIASGPAAVAEPQELKIVEHATTDAVTDTGAAGYSAGDILTSPMRSLTLTTRTRLVPTRAFASAPCQAKHGSVSGRSPWRKAS